MSMTTREVSFVLIPSDRTRAIETLQLDLSHLSDDGDVGGDQLPTYLNRHEEGGAQAQQNEIQITPLKRMSSSTWTSACGAGIYAYYRHSNEQEGGRNERATILSMSCGLFSRRFYGDVYLSRLGYHGQHRQLRNLPISSQEIDRVCKAGPDLRPHILIDLCSTDATAASNPLRSNQTPTWLINAAKANYQDSQSLSALASIMKRQSHTQQHPERDPQQDDSHNHDDDDSNKHDDASENAKLHDTTENDKSTIHIKPTNTGIPPIARNAVTKVPLCLHCRRPANTLCPGCGGAYFCDPPRTCITDGWSHQCICPTWALYTQRRKSLSKFPFLQWHLPLLTHECHLSTAPYRSYLKNVLCVLPDDNSPITRADMWWDDSAGSWWDTEVDGWEGGRSSAAEFVDPTVRRSYRDGFRLDGHMVMEEGPVKELDAALCMIERDECGLLRLKSWKEYYKLRRIPLTSPVALLCTYPLTVYYAIQRFGAVPITVAKMLKRRMRLHLIGIEKEMNFVDLFKEIGYLLPTDVMIEMLFIVRDDMLPPNCDSPGLGRTYKMSIDLTPNVSLLIQSGTYCETLDPSFDCGSGPPDMLVAMNAGLFAYDSWRGVIDYLRANTGVVGVFTDYNEHSAVNCASLGGGDARDSVCVNPFRQPRAMPVYSMNLPQFSNGFMYVYNEQELDM